MGILVGIKFYNFFRMYRVKKQYQQLRRAVIMAQKNWKRLQVTREYRKMRRGFIRLQATFRGRKVRKWFLRTRRRIMLFQVLSKVYYKLLLYVLNFIYSVAAEDGLSEQTSEDVLKLLLVCNHCFELSLLRSY